MFWNILAIENTKNLRRNLLWAELILLALIVISIFTFLYISIQNAPDGVTISTEDIDKIPHLVTWPVALEFAIHFVGRTGLGGLLLIVFVAAATAQEYTWRTLHLWLSRGTPRPLLLGVKFTALLLPTLMIVLTALVSGAAITLFFSMQINGTLHLDQLNFWQLGLSLLRTTFTMLPYVALTYLLAIATRSAVVSTGAGIAYTLIIESFLVQILAISKGNLGRMAKYLPVRLADSLLSSNQGMPGMAEGLSPGLLEPFPAVVCIALWTLALFCLTLWIFRRQDFTG